MHEHNFPREFHPMTVHYYGKNEKITWLDMLMDMMIEDWSLTQPKWLCCRLM
jgi:hypothetical protein